MDSDTETDGDENEEGTTGRRKRPKPPVAVSRRRALADYGNVDATIDEADEASQEMDGCPSPARQHQPGPP